LGDCFNAVRIIRVPVKPVLDTLVIVQRMSAAGLFQVHLKMNQKPVSPLCSGLAAVQMRNGLDFTAGIWRSSLNVFIVVS
jgi:hypothetical protein